MGSGGARGNRAESSSGRKRKIRGGALAGHQYFHHSGNASAARASKEIAQLLRPPERHLQVAASARAARRRNPGLTICVDSAMTTHLTGGRTAQRVTSRRV